MIKDLDLTRYYKPNKFTRNTSPTSSSLSPCVSPTWRHRVYTQEETQRHTSYNLENRSLLLRNMLPHAAPAIASLNTDIPLHRSKPPGKNMKQTALNAYPSPFSLSYTYRAPNFPEIQYPQSHVESASKSPCTDISLLKRTPESLLSASNSALTKGTSCASPD